MPREMDFNNVQINKDFDFIIEEKSNTFIALRKIDWKGNGEEKLDLRKYFVNSDGNEVMGKGVGFMTEEGPHELVKILIENGYGHTEEILEALSSRPDFNTGTGGWTKEDLEGTYYDPKELIK